MDSQLLANGVSNGAANGPGASAIERLAEHHLSRKIQAGHILNHNAANSLYADVISFANRIGLSESDKAKITPFPQPTSNTTINIEGGVNDALVALVRDLCKPQQTLPPVDTVPGDVPDTVPDTVPCADGPAKKRRYWPLALAAGLAAGGAPAGYYAYQWYNRPAEVQPANPGDVGADMGVTIR